MGKLPVVKGHAEVVKSLYQMKGEDDTTIQRGIVQGKRRPDNNLCQSQALRHFEQSPGSFDFHAP